MSPTSIRNGSPWSGVESPDAAVLGASGVDQAQRVAGACGRAGC